MEDGPFSSRRDRAHGCVVVDEGRDSRTFQDPLEVLVAEKPEDVPGILARIDGATLAGHWVAGYISYDAGIGLNRPMKSRHRPDVPLIWLGVYEQCGIEPRRPIAPAGRPEPAAMNLSSADYVEAVEQVKRYIEAGDAYQVNFTAKLRFDYAGSAWSLFEGLRSAHPVDHAAFVDAGDFQVVSLSPELFLMKAGGEVLTRPMKGTAPRGRFTAEDDRLAAELRADPKNRAENLMIVDLMRNDLGRVCRTGTVSTPELFRIERYPSLLQMTSDVVGTLKPDTSFANLLRATFPPGSVTGAPKLRAMEIIDELESESRGVYCGTVGWFAPNGDCRLNVAIRTIVKRGGRCELGVGGGIVADSDPASEYREALLKGAFLSAASPGFGLFETIKWTSEGGFVWLEEHLDRLGASCARFGIPFDRDGLRSSLHGEARGRESGASRIRATISAGGEVATVWNGLGPGSQGPWRVRVASTRVDSHDLKLYHKTTDRSVFDLERRAAVDAGFDEAIFINERGELTEGAITNLFVFDGKTWSTPPVSCGLLPGIWRAKRIAEGAVEEDLTLGALARFRRVVMGNSVRGQMEVGEIVDAEGRIVWVSGKRCAPSDDS